MCIPLPLLGALAGGASAAAGVYSAVEGRKSAKEANKLQQQALQQAEDAANKPKPQGPKAPDRPVIAAANMAANSKGNASTFLTGPGGVDPSSLNLGKNTLLGQ